MENIVDRGAISGNGLLGQTSQRYIADQREANVEV